MTWQSKFSLAAAEWRSFRQTIYVQNSMLLISILVDVLSVLFVSVSREQSRGVIVKISRGGISLFLARKTTADRSRKSTWAWGPWAYQFSHHLEAHQQWMHWMDKFGSSVPHFSAQGEGWERGLMVMRISCMEFQEWSKFGICCGRSRDYDSSIWPGQAGASTVSSRIVLIIVVVCGLQRTVSKF